MAGDQTNIGGGGAGGGGSDVGGAGTQAAKQSAKRVAIYQKLLMTGARARGGVHPLGGLRMRRFVP